MKNYIFKLLSLTIVVAMAACSDDNDKSIGNALSTESIIAYAHRSVNTVNVQTEESWVATTDAPWIQISPANGLRSAECKVIVDSTVVQSSREARVRFTFNSGESKYLQVTQSGYLPTIELKDSIVNLENYASLEERYFDINVYTNVRFNVSVANVEGNGSTSWIRSEAIDFNFDRGARPRDVKVRFKWENNNIPVNDRRVMVKFDPIDATDYEYERQDSLLVIQKPGMLIEDSRAGDSLAILAITRGLNCWYMSDPSELLHNWEGIEVWEASDKGATPQNIGRVKSANFTFFNTNEPLPYEIRYLKHVETLEFFSNANNDDKALSTGDSFYYIKDNLKKLVLFAYGLVELDESFKELKNLEYLALSNNEFGRIPEMINKENFPNMKELFLNTGFMKGNLKDYMRFFTWDTLEQLHLNINSFWGNIPTEEQISEYYLIENGIEMPRYTAQDCIDEKLPAEHEGKFKILPKMMELRLNGNQLTGIIPDWVLYHPNLYYWGADVLLYNQDAGEKDPEGNTPGFVNTPYNDNYYYEYYKDKYENNDY